jgi:hypothetical protein
MINLNSRSRNQDNYTMDVKTPKEKAHFLGRVTAIYLVFPKTCG